MADSTKTGENYDRPKLYCTESRVRGKFSCCSCCCNVLENLTSVCADNPMKTYISHPISACVRLETQNKHKQRGDTHKAFVLLSLCST